MIFCTFILPLPLPFSCENTAKPVLGQAVLCVGHTILCLRQPNTDAR